MATEAVLTYTDAHGEHTVRVNARPTTLGALEVDGHPIDHPDAHTEIESALHRLVQALGHLPAGTWHTGP